MSTTEQIVIRIEGEPSDEALQAIAEWLIDLAQDK